MKKYFLTGMVILLATVTASSQYYYKDILNTAQLSATLQTYKNNKIRNIDIKSFENDGTESEGFICRKKISKDYKTVSLFTKFSLSEPSLFISEFNTSGMLLYTNDSSNISVTSIRYQYDDKKRIQSIVSKIRSQDDDFVNQIVEEHLYNYAEGNNPVQMLKIKNHKDTTVILFANDEHGNLAIEKDTRSGTKYYYYYDSNNRLTDVVQENDFKLKPMPDYFFEYGHDGNISKMTATEEGSNNYYTWKYVYENGLRTVERCYLKGRSLVGSVEYIYK
ncbi:MAG TPA: hypothetical protein PLU18_02615 [Ferruginibacter sp.]|nr:hypothetical protein [Ferruginibacter sp.]